MLYGRKDVTYVRLVAGRLCRCPGGAYSRESIFHLIVFHEQEWIIVEVAEV
jgi:hypothetical protein